MPKRVIDGDAIWGSNRLTTVPPSAQREYPWLYPLADSNGSFEITNLRTIWGKVYINRPDVPDVQNLDAILRDYNNRGLLFIWEQGGKRYAHWTNSHKPGRLPPKSRRAIRHENLLAPIVPTAELEKYTSYFTEQSSDASGKATLGLPSGYPPAAKALALALALVKDKNTLSESQEPGTGDEGEVAEYVRRIWEFYLQRLGKNPKMLTFTILRKRKAIARFQECLKKTDGDPVKAEGMMRACVEALASSKFHMGENDSGKRYDSWEKHLFPSQEKLEFWLERAIPQVVSEPECPYLEPNKE
jgi:hypothetical protein